MDGIKKSDQTNQINNNGNAHIHRYRCVRLGIFIKDIKNE
jgi:hypothetical protein